MDTEKTLTLDEAHRHFAVTAHSETWALLEHANRTPDEDEHMVRAAYASAYHWRFAGSGVHAQRAEWLLSRVLVVLGRGEQALRHARRCMTLTDAHGAELEDFDAAFAYEALARALAAVGRSDEAQEHHELARQCGTRITDLEDRRVFERSLAEGPWNGL